MIGAIMGTHSHHAEAFKSLNVAVLSVSSTRDLVSDTSGQWIVKQVGREGHHLADHQVVTDHVASIRRVLAHIISTAQPHAVIVTGGTGITLKDVTLEAIQPLFTKEMTAFGPVFAQLSFEQIDSAAILSRATAGIIGRCVVFCIPGSLKACKLACKALIFPELGHATKHLAE